MGRMKELLEQRLDENKHELWLALEDCNDFIYYNMSDYEDELKG